MALSPTEESLVRQLIAQNPALLNLASSESTIISKLGATKVSLSDLSAATSLSDADLALVRQGLNDKSFAMSVLRDYVNGKLPAASETVAGVVEIATPAEAQAFTAGKAIDGAKLAAAFQGANQSTGFVGFQIHPGGLIEQWASTGNVSGAGTQTVINFPFAFTGTAKSVLPVASSSGDVNGTVLLFTASGFTIVNHGPAPANFLYRAWGY